MKRVWVVLAVAAAVAAVAPGGAEPADGSAVLGHTIFRVYCASCHGEAGHGDGNIAEYLTPRPADLTRLSERADGEFPAEMVYRAIDGRQPVPGHGSRDMPVWGDVFQKADALEEQPQEVRESEVKRKVEALVAYLESIQASDRAATGGRR